MLVTEGPLAVVPGGELASEGDDSDDESSDDSSSDDSSAASVDCVIITWTVKCSLRCDGVQVPLEVIGPENGGAPCPESQPCGPPCEP